MNNPIATIMPSLLRLSSILGGILLLTSLGSCQRNEDDLNPNTSELTAPKFEVVSVKSYNTGNPITMGLDLNFGSEARILQYSEDATTGALAPLPANTNEQVHIFLRRAGDSKTTAMATITWRGRTSQRLQITSFSINLPEGVTAKPGEEWYIAGILGGELDPTTGKVWIGKNKDSEGNLPILEGNTVDMPYSFGWQRVQIQEANRITTPSTILNPIGTMLRLQFYSNMAQDYEGRHLRLTTNALRPSGSLEILSTGNELSTPLWQAETADSDAPISWTYALGNKSQRQLLLPAAQGWTAERTLLVWGMPTSVDATQTSTQIELQARLASSQEQGIYTQTYAQEGHRVFKSGNTYRLSNVLTSDLLISEIYYQLVPGESNAEARGTRHNYSIIELYNPTATAIDLSEYALARTVYKGREQLYFRGGTDDLNTNPSEAVLQLLSTVGSTNGNSYKLVLGSANSASLAPGKTILIGAGGYISTSYTPGHNIDLYNQAIASNPSMASSTAQIRATERKYLPRAGKQIDSAILKGYAQAMVAMDGGIYKDQHSNYGTNGGVLQISNGQGIALLKRRSATEWQVLDISTPMGGGSAIQDYRTKLLQAIQGASSDAPTSLDINQAMSYSIVRTKGIDFPSSQYKAEQWVVSSSENDGVKSLGTRSYVAGLTPYERNYSAYSSNNNPKGNPFWSQISDAAIPTKDWNKLPQRGDNVFNNRVDPIEDRYSLIHIAGGSASEIRPDGTYPFSNSYDGNTSTFYHSLDASKGSRLPITLTYLFDQPQAIEKIVYTPRQDKKFGRWGQVDIVVTYEDNTTQTHTQDFGQTGTVTTITWEGLNSKRAKQVSFIVRSTNYGGCAVSEVAFYSNNDNYFDPSLYFTDKACTELRKGITYQEIMQIKHTFFREMIRKMYQGTYDKEFRITTRHQLVDPATEKRNNKTQFSYSRYNGATGISVKQGEELVVFLDAPAGVTPKLVFQNLMDNGYGGPEVPLQAGMNKIIAPRSGLVYLLHSASRPSSSNDIKLHFATGTVNGYFDATNPTHKGRWKELLSKATDPCFDVLGEHAHITFPTAKFREYTDDGNDLIGLYDRVVVNEMELLGLYKYNRVFTNRSYFMYDKDGRTWATEFRTGYQAVSAMLAPSVFRQWTWGIGHEQGHQNQTQGLLWGGMIEITNNICSAYIENSIFNIPSRLLGRLGDRYTQAWNSLLGKSVTFSTQSQDTNTLIPFWQLELYFGNVLHHTPRYQSDKGGFYPDLYETLRNYSSPTPIDASSTGAENNGKQQVNFALHASRAAKMDLTDFFEAWGFFRPANYQSHLNVYKNVFYITVTQDYVDQVKAQIKALGYPKPQVAIQYITTGNQDLFSNPQAVVTGSASISDRVITLRNWRNVVAYEIVDASGRLLYTGTGWIQNNTDSNLAKLTLDFDWQSGYSLRAISATGARTTVPL